MKMLAGSRELGRWVAVVALGFVLLAGSAQAETVDGFVTQMTGRVLQIGTVRVRLDDKTQCSKYDEGFAALTYDRKMRRVSLPCTALILSVGSYVHVRGTPKDDGTFAADTLEMSDPWRVAKTHESTWKYLRLKPMLRLISSLSGGPLRGKLTGGSFLEEPIYIVKTKNETFASLWINGFPLQVTKSTALSMITRDIDRDSMVQIGTDHHGNLPVFPRLPNPVPVAFPASDHLTPGIFLAYRGTQQANGQIVAKSLIICPGVAPKPTLNGGDGPPPEVVEPDYEAHTPGSIRYRYGDAIQIVGDRNLQTYVRRVGTDLIPPYQQAIGSKNNQTPNIRFYVVRPFENSSKNAFVQIDGRIRNIPSSEWRRGIRSPFVLPDDHTRIDGIVEMADGMILIPDTFLVKLHSEAELAFSLSIAVQSIVQQQEDIAVGAVKSGYGAYAMPAAGIGYLETMLALRLSIRQMYLAGYDIREAPFAWAVAQGKTVSNPVIDSKNPDQEIPWYAAYGFDYISKYYGDVDYSKLKRGEGEYAEFLGELRKGDPEAFGATK